VRCPVAARREEAAAYPLLPVLAANRRPRSVSAPPPPYGRAALLLRFPRCCWTLSPAGWEATAAVGSFWAASMEPPLVPACWDPLAEARSGPVPAPPGGPGRQPPSEKSKKGRPTSLMHVGSALVKTLSSDQWRNMQTWTNSAYSSSK
jgi:hypothetical protein